MKTLPAIVILVLIIVGAIFFTKKSPDQAIPESTSPTPITESMVTEQVVYTGTGYSPSTLEVKSGTKVIFLNQADSSMWTASNPHPIHTDLTGFDSKKGVATGLKYEFTFTEAGTFSYHNHLSPEHTGTIVVTN